jgi:hypothetical protein
MQPASPLVFTAVNIHLAVAGVLLGANISVVITSFAEWAVANCRLIRVIEVAATHDLHLEVIYPIDWENKISVALF